jgi:hypothetical protein
MNKSKLLKFIDLYNLSGVIEKVKLEADGKALKVGMVTEDRTLMGSVVFDDLKFEAGEYPIHDTAQFRKMLSILDDEIKVVVNKYDGKAMGLVFSDKNTESYVTLADESVIPKTPTLAKVVNFDVEITIDDDFIERYIRAKNALTDTQTFTLMMGDKSKKLEMIIGHSNINTNRVKLEIKTAAGKDVAENSIDFNAEYFKEVLSKNRGCSSTVFKVNTKGLGHLHFKTAEYEANYYMIKATVKV